MGGEPGWGCLAMPVAISTLTFMPPAGLAGKGNAARFDDDAAAAAAMQLLVVFDLQLSSPTPLTSLSMELHAQC